MGPGWGCAGPIRGSSFATSSLQPEEGLEAFSPSQRRPADQGAGLGEGLLSGEKTADGIPSEFLWKAKVCQGKHWG